MEANLGVSSRLASLYHQIYAANKQANLITSPLSVYACFALVAEGTTGNTWEQLKSAFGYGDRPQILGAATQNALKSYFSGANKAVTIKMSNAFYGGVISKIKEAFIKDLQEKHAAHAETVDFSAPATTTAINQRITDATNGLLKDTISQGTLSADTVAVLVNTIYFKGIWEIQFKKENTYVGPFTKSDNSVAQVSFMANNKVKVALHEEGDLTYVAIPYTGGKVKFIVEINMKGALAGSVVANVLETSKIHCGREVDLHLPKFKAEFKASLVDTLKSFGVTEAFKPSQDFNSISEGQIAVSDVIHQAFIQVDEEGTEAAAATVVVMTRCMAAPKQTIRINRPFHFHIVDSENDLVLFSGTIQTPQF